MTLNWTHLQAAYDPDFETHWAACQALGLDCPIEVFEELFFEHHENTDFAALYRAIDWSTVTWDAVELSGVALRRVAVDRGYQYAVDEARRLTFAHGVDDEREDVVVNWIEYRTWLRPPILVTGAVTGSGYQYELLVGFTRLGNLLGLLDRAEVPEAQRHRVWIGRPVE